MHILLGLISAAGLIAFYLYRARQVAEVTHELGDMAATARGAVRRFFWRRRTQVEQTKTLDDPALAASTMMCALAQSDSLMTDRERQVILEQMARTFQIEGREAEELFAQARWLTNEMQELDGFLRRLAKPVNERCTPLEKAELIEMLSAVAAADGPPDALQSDAIRRLSQQLGLTHH